MDFFQIFNHHLSSCLLTYLGESCVRELLEAEVAVLPGLVVELSKVNPGRRQGRDRHAVAKEQDHVLGNPFDGSDLHLVLELTPGVRPPEPYVCKIEGGL